MQRERDGWERSVSALSPYHWLWLIAPRRHATPIKPNTHGACQPLLLAATFTCTIFPLSFMPTVLLHQTELQQFFFICKYLQLNSTSDNPLITVINDQLNEYFFYQGLRNVFCWSSGHWSSLSPSNTTRGWCLKVFLFQFGKLIWRHCVLFSLWVAAAYVFPLRQTDCILKAAKSSFEPQSKIIQIWHPIFSIQIFLASTSMRVQFFFCCKQWQLADPRCIRKEVQSFWSIPGIHHINRSQCFVTALPV